MRNVSAVVPKIPTASLAAFSKHDSDLHPSQRIPEMSRFPIRLILKPILNRLLTLTHTMQSVLTPIIPNHPLPQEQRHNNHSTVTSDQTRQCRKVPRLLLRKENVRAGDVARSIEHEPKPVGCGAFGVACNVRREEVPGENYGGADKVLEPCTADEGPAVREGGEPDADEAAEGRETDECEDDTARIFEVACCQPAQRDEDEFDRAADARPMPATDVDAGVEDAAAESGAPMEE